MHKERTNSFVWIKMLYQIIVGIYIFKKLKINLLNYFLSVYLFPGIMNFYVLCMDWQEQMVNIKLDERYVQVLKIQALQ